MNEIVNKINKLLRLEYQIGLLGPRTSRELLFTLSSKAYQQLNEECNVKRERPSEICTFIGPHGDVRILEDNEQADDVLAYYRSG